MISPQLRRALHTALDVVLDALEEEAAGTKPKRTRTITPPPVDDSDLTPEALESARQHLARAGYKRKAA
jgi:hypothetical protein